MSRGKPFECEVTVSSGVEEKLARKHDIEIWEIEEVIYGDLNAFSLKYKDCHFIYGQTSSGRHLLVLTRVLKREEVQDLGFPVGTKVVKIITARDMNDGQQRFYRLKKGKKT